MSDEPQFISIFDTHGVEEIVGGNTPFCLEGADNVWLVRSGKIEVFSVSLENGNPKGARDHFLTAAPGDILFGMDLEEYGMGLGFLAVGIVGTRLSKLDIAHLREAASSGGADGLSDAIDLWIQGISVGATKTIVPKPHADLTLLPGEDGVLGDLERGRADKGVIWAEHVEGESLFIGIEEVSGAEPGSVFPLTTETFLQAMGDVRVKASATEEVVSNGLAWAGLQAFYSAVFQSEFYNVGLARADELNRLKDKGKRDRRIVSRALANLASVLVRGRAPSLTDADDPLLGAVRLIGDRMGFTVKPPQKRKDEAEHADLLDEIVRASRVRTREIILKGEWLERETTPFLAFFEDGHRPVAIWARAPRKYEVHDPAPPPEQDSVTELTPELAATLEPKAHAFYRPFPDGAMTAWKIFRFGLEDNGKDLARPLLFGFVAGLLALLPPYFTGLLVQTVIPEAARDRLLDLAMVLAAAGITTVVLGLVRRLGILRLEIKMSSSVQPAMWDRLINLPVSFFRKYVAGDLSTRVSAIDQIRQVLSGATMTTVVLGVFSLLYVAQMTYYSWDLALLAVALAAIVLAVALFCSYWKLRVQRDLMKTQGKISGLVLQLLSGIAKLRVAGAEGRALAEWARHFAHQKRLTLRTGGVDVALATFNSGFPVVASMVVFYAMFYYTEQAFTEGRIPMQLGDFITFNAAFGMLLSQMLELGTVALSVLMIVPLFERARPILETEQEVDESSADVGELNGQIEVSHVSFRYQEDGPLILDDVTIDIPEGKYIAFVGPSGSGKSTLLRLMLGLEKPESGAIYFDGRDLSQLNVQQLRNKIGVVIQNARIRPGSIFDNIVGARPLTIDDAWEAARMAGFDQDIQEMPMKMHTILQQGGGSLSGGQRQRLMIARAVVAKPRLLFFDEATSALDNRTQSIVSESMQAFQSTRIAIAHRLSTIIGADRIYVLVGGKVVQAGSYEELAAEEGIFADLVRRQVA